MSKANDLAAKAARLRAANQAPPPASEPAESVPTEISRSVPAEPAVTVRTKPVRMTVDVSPSEHADLVRLSLEAGAALGTTRVPGQEIVRALLRRYLRDAELQTQVHGDVVKYRRDNRLR